MMTFETLCVSEGKHNNTTPPHQLPIYATSSFAFESVEDTVDVFTGQKSGHSYSRYGNPTIDTVADKIARLEAFGSDISPYGFLTSSGMSAISTLVMALVGQGDTILTQSNLYGGTTELFSKVLSRQGVNSIFAKLDDLSILEQHLSENKSIKLIYLETPANPTMQCLDLKAIADVAKRYNVLTAVDNTFCTPYLQRPLSLGIDFVVHSTTKYLNGHGNSISGAIVGHQDEYKKPIHTALKLIGSTCNSWDAWLINNGLKTLTLRMDRHSSNALALANFLSTHPKVEKTNYPGLTSSPTHHIAKKQMSQYGGMLSFDVGSEKAALKVINALKIATNAPTLGDVDTLVLHPITSSHLNVDSAQRAANGLTPGLIRLSVGIENEGDLLGDLERALRKLCNN
jgi:methionine-gamma-lyase